MAQPISRNQLARRAIELRCGIGALGTEIIAIPPPMSATTGAYGPLVGVRCGAQVSAVAYPIGPNFDFTIDDALLIAVVVSRTKDPIVFNQGETQTITFETERSPLIDVGRRVLGIPTPREETPSTYLFDVVWIDRLVTTYQQLPQDGRLIWEQASKLHPIADSPLDPWRLLARREEFSLRWETLRVRACEIRARWPGISPSLAGWLDEGSFARWCLAHLPDLDVILNDFRRVCEPQLMASVEEALGRSSL